MNHRLYFLKKVLPFFIFVLIFQIAGGQPLRHAWSASSLRFGASNNVLSPDLNSFNGVQWEKEGHLFTRLEDAGRGYQIVEYNPAKDFSKNVLATSGDLTTENNETPLDIESYTWYNEKNLLLLFTNAKRVWRAKTRGDFWIYNIHDGILMQLGKGLPESSLQFAKISPDGKKAAYVSEHNIYVEHLETGERKQLTQDGTERIINGTFDWVYEEELFCRDGFRWSPDSKSIAYWHIDARNIGTYLMLNTTDSVYSYVIPVQYPKVGYAPSSAKVGVVNISTGNTEWIPIPGDSVKHYLPRMEWIGDNHKLMVQQFNRKQDSCWLYLVNTKNNKVKTLYSEGDSAWIDLNYFWQYDRPGWDWIDGGKSFLWRTEKDGWRHVYKISKNGKQEKLITPGVYDVIDIVGINRKSHLLYFYASPKNATQRYLYKVNINEAGKPIRLSPEKDTGTHTYDVSPDGLFAIHTFSNHITPPQQEFVSLHPYKVIKEIPSEIPESLADNMVRNPKHFFKVTTSEGITMDGWVIKPADFDSTKKYPVLFYVYGEPASTTVKDNFSPNSWYQKLADMGYVIISIDNPGTPAPKGRAWRKALFQNIGIGNIHQQAMAATKILKKAWIDSSRVAVWGWSGGGSSTQNLLFQYPDIYQTGMAVAGVSNMLYYDNVYEERYMGLLPQSLKYYKEGSSVNHVKGLEGNLLIVHGSGDDNVHYQNQEALINALIAAGKQFSMMEYPNRTHAINEGKGTTRHLYTLLTHYLVNHCPPGGR